MGDLGDIYITRFGPVIVIGIGEVMEFMPSDYKTLLKSPCAYCPYYAHLLDDLGCEGWKISCKDLIGRRFFVKI